MDDYPKWIKQQIPQCFSFAYTLIPDELQSQQLVIDSYEATLLDRVSFEGNEKEQIQLELLKRIYELAERRSYQLEGQVFSAESISPKNEIYYSSLGIKQRAVLFLYHKAQRSLDDIAVILKLKRFEAIEFLHSSRNGLRLALEKGNVNL
ncbi:MAG: hypothetical protein JNM93_13180 [Bacteriovoracaceae bacterium]|nr:hypothetical protein [Bacteriovoracaceae bacterium]